jgi:hypothetical protein
MRDVARIGKVFPSDKALEEYLLEHPKADESKHSVEEKSSPAKKKEDAPPKPPAKSRDEEEAKSPKKAKPPAKKTRFTSKEMNLPEVPHQPVSDPDKLWKQAAETMDLQLDWLNRGKSLDAAIGAKVVRADKGDPDPDYSKPGPIILIGPLKRKERSKQKVDEWMGGDWSQLCDIVRASVAVDSMDEVDDVLDKLRKQGLKLARPPKDRFANPTEAGYRDLMMNVEYPNGHVGELQIHLKPILEAKSEAHKIYAVARSISSKAKEEGRDFLTLKEQADVEEANHKMRSIYDAAWKKATGKGDMPKQGAKSAGTKYYEYNGVPARWESGKLPVTLRVKGDRLSETVEYDLEGFFQNATVVDKKRFDAMSKALTKGKEKKGSLRSATIRLAAANPALRPWLLPLLRD